MGQMTQGVTYCHSLFYATQPAEELAAFLVDSTSGKMARVFISSSGSEAVEAALKMARQYHVEKEQKGGRVICRTRRKAELKGDVRLTALSLLGPPSGSNWSS